MRVSLPKPGGHGSRVATANDEHLASLVRVHLSNEVSQVSQSLLRVQVTEILELPRVEWLRVTVEAMLEDHESSLMIGTNHERIEAGVRDGAAVLATNVDKDGSRAIPVLVTDPVPLVILAPVQEVEVVHQVLECLLLELIKVD